MRLKTCPECGKEKSAIHFSGDRTKADGLSRICRDCTSEYQSRRRIVMKTAGKTIKRMHSFIPPNSF